MKIQGEHFLAAPQDLVWEALLDAEVLSATVPGSQGLEQISENEFEGKLKIKVGPVQGVFQGKVSLSDLEPPSSYRIKIEGRGPVGFMSGGGTVKLSESDGGTLLGYDVTAQIGGRIAGLGQRLMDSTAKVITRQTLEALGAQIEARAADDAEDVDEEGAVEPAPPRPATESEFAAEVGKGVVAELVPEQYRRMAVMAIVGLGAAGAVLALRGCG